MIDLIKTIEAKSDQLNSDDLIGGAITVKITKVSLLAGEQPVAINYEGDNGKPFLPCKSMRRVLIGVWGSDGNKYIGRHMTLFRDNSVMFAGQAVGGIRISHMSDIDKAVTMSLTATKKTKKPFTVQPLIVEQKKATIPDAEKKAAAKKKADSFIKDIEQANSLDVLESATEAAVMDRLKQSYPDLYKAVNDAITKKTAEFVTGDNDGLTI